MISLSLTPDPAQASAPTGSVAATDEALLSADAFAAVLKGGDKATDEVPARASRDAPVPMPSDPELAVEVESALLDPPVPLLVIAPIASVAAVVGDPAQTELPMNLPAAPIVASFEPDILTNSSWPEIVATAANPDEAAHAVRAEKLPQRYHDIARVPQHAVLPHKVTAPSPTHPDASAPTPLMQWALFAKNEQVSPVIDKAPQMDNAAQPPDQSAPIAPESVDATILSPVQPLGAILAPLVGAVELPESKESQSATEISLAQRPADSAANTRPQVSCPTTTLPAISEQAPIDGAGSNLIFQEAPEDPTETAPKRAAVFLKPRSESDQRVSSTKLGPLPVAYSHIASAGDTEGLTREAAPSNEPSKSQAQMPGQIQVPFNSTSPPIQTIQIASTPTGLMPLQYQKDSVRTALASPAFKTDDVLTDPTLPPQLEAAAGLPASHKEGGVAEIMILQQTPPLTRPMPTATETTLHPESSKTPPELPIQNLAHRATHLEAVEELALEQDPVTSSSPFQTMMAPPVLPVDVKAAASAEAADIMAQAMMPQQPYLRHSPAVPTLRPSTPNPRWHRSVEFKDAPPSLLAGEVVASGAKNPADTPAAMSILSHPTDSDLTVQPAADLVRLQVATPVHSSGDAAALDLRAKNVPVAAVADQAQTAADKQPDVALKPLSDNRPVTAETVAVQSVQSLTPLTIIRPGVIGQSVDSATSAILESNSAPLTKYPLYFAHAVIPPSEQFRTVVVQATPTDREGIGRHRAEPPRLPDLHGEPSRQTKEPPVILDVTQPVAMQEPVPIPPRHAKLTAQPIIWASAPASAPTPDKSHAFKRSQSSRFLQPVPATNPAVDLATDAWPTRVVQANAIDTQRPYATGRSEAHMMRPYDLVGRVEPLPTVQNVMAEPAIAMPAAEPEMVPDLAALVDPLPQSVVPAIPAEWTKSVPDSANTKLQRPQWTPQRAIPRMDEIGKTVTHKAAPELVGKPVWSSNQDAALFAKATPYDTIQPLNVIAPRFTTESTAPEPHRKTIQPQSDGLIPQATAWPAAKADMAVFSPAAAPIGRQRRSDDAPVTLTHQQGAAYTPAVVAAPPPPMAPTPSVPSSPSAAQPAFNTATGPREMRRLPHGLAPSIARAASRGTKDSQVELTLDPVELGKLRFEIITTSDRTQINLSVERTDTLDLLRRHADVLRAEFREAGFDGASLNFSQWTQQGKDQDSGQSVMREFEADDLTLSRPDPVLQRNINTAGQGLDLRL